MPGTSYAQIHERLQELIIWGTRVSDSIAGTPAAEIHNWIEQARSCLWRLGDRIPEEAAAFDGFGRDLEFKVKEGNEFSSSAYSPEGADCLADFRFENLRQMNGILKFAAQRVVALVNETEPSSKGAFFDVRRLKAARIALGVTQQHVADWFHVSERTIKRWESGQAVMRHDTHQRLKPLIEWAQQGRKGLPPEVPQMSP